MDTPSFKINIKLVRIKSFERKQPVEQGAIYRLRFKTNKQTLNRPDQKLSGVKEWYGTTDERGRIVNTWSNWL